AAEGRRMSEPAIALRVTEIRYEAAGVSSFVLRHEKGEPLPRATPGSHIDIHLRNGLVRSYSISNGATDSGAYRLTVAHDPNGAGGSMFLRDGVKVGDILTAAQPRNNFPLVEQAPLSLFIAGGIGVTPFVPMMTALNSARRRWRLLYCAKTKERAPLHGE